ncbi:poliovirus receptor isoform X2 [Danio rerio]|uniref:Nectin cell adhesion molecule 3 n=1 Tax=Danio rerio TaxID=7955 RepID=A0AB32U077_DANRE
MNGVSFNRLEQEMLYYHRWRSKTVILLFVYFLICVRISGEEVIGHDTAVEYGERANLLCHLTDTKEDITLIMWKKTTKRKTEEDIFFVIHQDDKTEHINGLGDRVQFIGSFAERNGSIQLRGMEFLDEGTYTCIFNLFPSGPIATYIKASVFARPAVTVKGEEPVIGCLEVILASCFASNARPAAEVTWRLGELEKSLKTRTNHTVNANETITVVSYLLGVPFKHLHKKNIQCVVKHNSLTEHLVLNYTIDIHYPPESVIIIPDSSTDVNEFRCIVDSNPQPTLKGYNWTRVNKSSQFFEGNRLPVPNMTPELNGLYICNASNKYGSALGSLYVNVHAGDGFQYHRLTLKETRIQHSQETHQLICHLFRQMLHRNPTQRVHQVRALQKKEGQLRFNYGTAMDISTKQCKTTFCKHYKVLATEEEDTGT